MEGLYGAEQTLLEEWRDRWQEQHGQYECFNADGIVDYACWKKLSGGKHILVILKETNGLSGSLTEFL